ncbi:hypothetical protein D3C87_1400120 [compost metagenome]
MKNLKPLSKAEMKKVLGGVLNPGDACIAGVDFCPLGYTCTGGYCLNGDGLTCTIVAREEIPGCGNGATITFPAGTSLNDAYNWCANQTCCNYITC